MPTLNKNSRGRWRWRARVHLAEGEVYLGMFDTAEEARQVELAEREERGNHDYPHKN